ncbi:hypothetical protein C8F04DRAFT_1189696 [Mycena alexandri]|uniref:CxC2-like cysteine cluster KDZ transposase-associated domain-containing protein n=1 Tax=Mycena alexandri TaxID=1745969 RepID=A0AAD6WWH4_9AGAR|nr:hypothetical protein C8F04DRAFT_1189696 [Mycena alexandri]
MKAVGIRRRDRIARAPVTQPSETLFATNVPSYTVTFHTETEHHYVVNASPLRKAPTSGAATEQTDSPAEAETDSPPEGPSLPFMDATDEDSGAAPAYETTGPSKDKAATIRKSVTHMNEFREKEAIFLQLLLSLHYSAQVLTPCSCGIDKHVRKVACRDCLQVELLCRQCWLNKHRTMPTHWAFVWKQNECFFEKTDICRVMSNTSIGLGHHGERCPDAELLQSFTLVDTNGIHANQISFCQCRRNGKRIEEYEQLTSAGIFPGSVMQAGTGYTIPFLLVQFWWVVVDNIYANFLVISRFYEYLQMVIQSGHALDVDVPLLGKSDRPYPNRPNGFLGSICAACPERGVNMPFILKSPTPGYLRDVALTDGRMHFPLQVEYEEMVKNHVVAKEDTEVPCKAHIGSIRHQGSAKYGHVKRSGVVASACDHSVAGSFVDMLKGEAYDSWCSFVVNMVKRATDQFPEEKWLHTVLDKLEGQIPAYHINGHGVDCQVVWQAVDFACRAHFHGETAEVLWAFLNGFGSSTRQMTEGARHDTINFIVDAWNCLKIVRQAELSADERVEALGLFELHMAVLEDLSRQHPAEVPAWSRESRVATKSDGKISILTIESVLDSMIPEEREKIRREAANQPRTSLAQWIHDGIGIQRQQILLIALLKRHKEHPLQDTWDTISKLRDSLNAGLTTFRERQLNQSVDADGEDAALREAEIKLRCSQADNGILAVQGACLALSAVNKARELDYRGQNGVTHSTRNREKAELMKTYEITMYNIACAALVDLGHMHKDAVEPYPPLSIRDTRRKETHLSQRGDDIQAAMVSRPSAAVASRLGPEERDVGSEDDDDRLMAGTQTLKRAGPTPSNRAPKRLKDIIPDDVNVNSPSSSSEAEESDTEMSPTKVGKKKKTSKKKPDGWIWLQNMTRGQKLSDGKLAEYKEESDRVQWFRAEAEMYRWLEQYERKHAEGFRVIERFRRDSAVWAGLAEREEQRNGVNGTSTYARMQAAMHSRLEHNARVTFKKGSLGAHHDWVSSSSFEELVTKIDQWREVVFTWMDDMPRRRRRDLLWIR